MKGFKNSTRMVQGHRFAAGGHVGHFAHPLPVNPAGPNRDTVNGLTARTPDMEGHGAVHRAVPATANEADHGGTTPLLPGYGHGGQIGKPMKAFHVHNHYHNGKKMPGKKARAKAEKKAMGGMVGSGKAGVNLGRNATSAQHETPSDHSEYAKGGKVGAIKKGALHKEMGIPQGQKIGKKRLESAKHSSSPKERKRANFALNMNKATGGTINTCATGGTIDKMNAGGAMYSKGGGAGGRGRC